MTDRQRFQLLELRTKPKFKPLKHYLIFWWCMGCNRTSNNQIIMLGRMHELMHLCRWSNLKVVITIIALCPKIYWPQPALHLSDWAENESKLHSKCKRLGDQKEFKWSGIFHNDTYLTINQALKNKALMSFCQSYLAYLHGQINDNWKKRDSIVSNS